MRNNDFEWNQFIKLGDMMGNGLHLEPGGKWITKEYNKLAKILIPDLVVTSKKVKQETNKRLNESIQKRLEEVKCPECNSELKQTRSGSKKVKCTGCDFKGTFKAKKK